MAQRKERSALAEIVMKKPSRRGRVSGKSFVCRRFVEIRIPQLLLTGDSRYGCTFLNVAHANARGSLDTPLGTTLQNTHEISV